MATGLFLAGGAGGALATSPDGVTWTSQTSSFSSDIRGITRSPDAAADAYAAEVGADSPVAWWRLGETVGAPLDYVGGNHADLMGQTNLRGQPDPFGGDGAIEFKNDSPGFRVPFAAVFGADEWTWEGWFRATDATEGNLLMNMDSGWTSGFQLWRDFAAQKIICYCGNGTGYFNLDTPDGSSPSDDLWHHYAATYDGVTLTVYIDGQVVLAEETSIVPNDSGDLWFGSEGLDWGVIGAGADEIAFYDYALPAQRIAAHYQWSSGLGLFVAVGDAGQLATSPDGINWTQQTSSFSGSAIYAVTWSSDLGLFVAVGDVGKIATSPDGINWTQRTSIFSSYVLGVTWSDDLGLFVAVGYDGKLATSPDGINWTQQTSSFGSTYILGVTWSSDLGLFVAVGDGGALATSPDGTNWTQRTSSFGSSYILGVTWSPELGLFVAVGESGKLATSPDGINWTQQTSSFSSDDIAGVTWSPDVGLFVAVGDAGKLATSPDGINWTQRTANLGSALLYATAWVLLVPPTATTNVVGLYIGDVPVLVPGGGGGAAWDLGPRFVSSFSVAGKETNPYDVAFSPDGTKMFIIGITSDSVHRYDLSTPWDITSSSFVSSFSVAAKETQPGGVTFSPDGAKMFVIGIDSDSVHRYDLSSPWDVTSASFISSFSVADQEINPRGVTFASDGTMMFIVGNTSDSVHRYDLSTPWDIASASHVSSFSVAGEETGPYDVTFAPDGTHMFIIGNGSRSVHGYDLSTPWDVTSASFVSSTLVADQEINPRGVAFSPDGTKMFVIGTTSDLVHRYDLQPED